MNKDSIFLDIRSKMEAVGFMFIKEQKPVAQKRDKEFVFTHERLKKQLEKDSCKKILANNFYIKPLSDDPNCEIGVIMGKTLRVAGEEHAKFPDKNAEDTNRNVPAWVNRENDNAIDKLLESIDIYLKTY